MIGLEFLRKMNNYTLQELADKVMVSKQYLSLLEKQKQKIPKKRAEQISMLFNVEQEILQKELTHIDIEKIIKIKLTDLAKEGD